jgi:hypothetical protein
LSSRDKQTELLINKRVLVVPLPGEGNEDEPFSGILQQPLYHDDLYVRDDDGNLTGPWQDENIYPQFVKHTSGWVGELTLVKGELFDSKVYYVRCPDGKVRPYIAVVFTIGTAEEIGLNPPTSHDHKHKPIAGMMVVHPEDLNTVAQARTVNCEDCDRTYNPKTEQWQ